MIRKEKNGVEWLEFEIFEEFKKNLSHGIFLRKGGVSSGRFHSLNLNFKSEDKRENVQENLLRALSCLNLKEWRLAKLNHGSTILAHEDIPLTPKFFFDGIMTRQEGIGLGVTHADCQAALFFDPITCTLATVHSGWRGSVLNIFGKTVAKMKERFFARAENIFVAISPSLGPEEAEFIHYKKEFPPHFFPFQTKPHYFDFWEISSMQLQEAGIKREHIHIAKLSTYQNPNDFFSYRRSKDEGRNALIAAIKTSELS